MRPEIAIFDRVPWGADEFDVALIQGVLHHDDDPRQTIREALPVAREDVILTRR